MTRGRKPVPIERKKALGNPSHGGRSTVRALTVLPAADTPGAPDHLAERGQEAWATAWSVAGQWLSPTTDRSLVLRWCEMHDRHEEMKSILASEGYTTEGSKGQSVLHPLVTEIRQLEMSMTKLESLMGFTPTDRARLQFGEIKKVSALDQLLNGTS